jgi:hypothetical protein
MTFVLKLKTNSDVENGIAVVSKSNTDTILRTYEKKDEILTALVGDKIDVKIDKSLAVESSLNDMNTQSLYLLVKQEKAG